MADRVLGRLSGEELLQIIEQLDSDEQYFQDDGDEDDNITSLDNVGLNIEIPLDTPFEEQPVAVDVNAEGKIDNNVFDTEHLHENVGQYLSEDDDIIDDDSKDPDYNPNNSTESISDDETPNCHNEQNNIITRTIQNEKEQDLTDINNNSVNQGENDCVETSHEDNLSLSHRSRGRKRISEPENWARNVRRRKSAKGESFINSRGKQVPRKVIGEPCNCKSKCFRKLPEDCRSRVFHEFWDLGDKNKQDAYLFRMIQKDPVKRRRETTGERANVKCFSYKYFIIVNDGSKSEVCIDTFKSIHGIGLKRIKRVRKPPTVAPEDKRGIHSNRPNRIPEERIEHIREHITSFPKRQSHYSRTDNPNKYYLHENLNVRRMWLLYLGKYEPEELEKIRRREKYCPQVKLWLYRKVFNSDFNMSFGMPRTDTCAKCDQLELSIQNADTTSDAAKKSQLLKEKEMHLRKAEGAYEKLKAFTEIAKVDDEVDAYTFDFQQNLPVPCVTTSDLFYMRQLWTYNFGVHDLKTGDGIMHIWDESIAQRGSSEVCSCLEHTILSRHNDAKRLVLFSDSCCGQNKNKAMLTFLVTLCANSDKPYQRIDHFYLVRGHTYLPNDRDFALIEKRKKTELPQVPDDYVKIIQESRTVQPFNVVKVNGNDIKDYKVIGDKAVKQNLKSNDGEKVLIRSVMWFSFGASEEIDPVTGQENIIEHVDEVWCRYTHNVLESWKKVKLFKRGVKLDSLEADQKYDKPICIKAAKYKDLNDLVKRGLLSSDVADFYKKLPQDVDAHCVDSVDNDSEYEDDYTE